MPEAYCPVWQEAVRKLRKALDELEEAVTQAAQSGDISVWEEARKRFEEIRRREFQRYREALGREVEKAFTQTRSSRRAEYKIDPNDWLAEVEGDYLSYTYQKNPPTVLKAIRKISGHLDVTPALLPDFPQLREVGISLDVQSARSVNLPKLRKVGGSIFAKKARLVNLPELREVGGGILSSSTPD